MLDVTKRFLKLTDFQETFKSKMREAAISQIELAKIVEVDVSSIDKFLDFYPYDMYVEMYAEDVLEKIYSESELLEIVELFEKYPVLLKKVDEKYTFDIGDKCTELAIDRYKKYLMSEGSTNNA